MARGGTRFLGAAGPAVSRADGRGPRFVGVGGAAVPQIITRLTPASFGPYEAGDEPTDAYTPGTYASTAGDIDSVTAVWTVNGSPWDEVTPLDHEDVVGLSEVVEDDADPVNSRTFNYGTVAVPAAPPAPEETVPGVVVDWAAIDLGTGSSIAIQINEPPEDDGNSAITDYEYQIDGGSWVSMGFAEVPDSVTVGGLTEDQEYSVRVRAVNAVGAGDASAAQNVTPTEADAPVLSDFDFDDGELSVTSDEAGTLYWMTSEHETRTDQQIIDGTGAYDSGSFAVVAGPVQEGLALTTTPTDELVYIHAILETEDSRRSNQVSKSFEIQDNYAPMNADEDKVLWLRPDSVIAGTGDDEGKIVGWDDVSGSEYEFEVLTTAKPEPEGGGVKFIDGSGMRSKTNGFMKTLVDDGDTEVLVFVVAKSLGGSEFGVRQLWGENNDNGANQRWYAELDYRGTGNSRLSTRSNRFAALAHDRQMTGIEQSKLTENFISEHLFPTTTRGEVGLNGDISVSTAEITENFPQASYRMSICGRISNSGSHSHTNHEIIIYEVYATTDTSSENRDAIRAAFAAMYDITLHED